MAENLSIKEGFAYVTDKMVQLKRNWPRLLKDSTTISMLGKELLKNLSTVTEEQDYASSYRSTNENRRSGIQRQGK